MQFLGALFDRLLCVLFAILFCQLPQFCLQYDIRLSGTLQECRRTVNEYSQAAMASGKTLEGYILKFEKSGDRDFIAQGQIMERTVGRLENLNRAYEALKVAPWLLKPIYLGYYSEASILHATFESFAPGLSFTFETCVWIVIGALIGFLVSQAFEAALHHVRVRFS